MSSNIEKVGRCWSEYTAERVAGKHIGLSWWDAGPEICRRINRNISGNVDCDYTSYTLDKYFSGKLPLSHCLSLGCGAGSLERSLARQEAFQHCDAYDVSEGSIEIAKKLAKQEGFENISYSMADINNITLPSNFYDSVWIQGALHHFESLEQVYDQVKHALKPGGLLILNEYIGPSRFQFSERQKEIANLCLQLLPKDYRIFEQEAVEKQVQHSFPRNRVKWYLSRLLDKIRDGDLINTVRRRFNVYKVRGSGQGVEKKTIAFPTVRDVIAADPSEAVRSGEIVLVLQQYFEIIEMKALGGNILQFLLADIAGNFSRDEQGQALLKMLMNIEETLLMCGELTSDFAYIVARPRKEVCLTEIKN
jgi:2-polyprenyl-3-methyl-5-hydroxy-6-metoxy-1,4-benzoquinol methylase